MKKFLSGLIIGAMLCSFSVAFASEFKALTATFPVFVNGQKFESKKPIVVINGSTYIPLKAVGDVLGTKIVWNNELKRVEIGDAELNTNKYSRSNPAPVGEKQVVIVDNLTEKYTAEITVKDIVRGDNAWSMIEQANQFNDEPKEGYDYILAKINFKLLDINNDKSLSLSSVMFDMYSSDFEKYENVTVSSLDPELSDSLYKGAETEGWVAFQVKFEDTKPVIGFGQDYDGTGGVWFKAYQE